MHPVFAVLALCALASPGVEALGAGGYEAGAEHDFAAVRAELGLTGAAPMVGLERAEASTWERRARRDFEAVHAALGLSGAAPLVGLERYDITVRPPVAHAVLASGARRTRR